MLNGDTYVVFVPLFNVSVKIINIIKLYIGRLYNNTFLKIFMNYLSICKFKKMYEYILKWNLF